MAEPGLIEATQPFTLKQGQQLQLSPSRAKRELMFLQNTGATGTLYYAIGRPATPSDHRLDPTDFIEPRRAPRGSINVTTDSAAGASGVLTEG